jgi:hypothetical protein
MGRLAKIHTDITYRMIERVIQGRLKYLLSGEEEDPFNNGRTTRVTEVSSRMRRALVEELRYTHEEIDFIEPQIAAVVLERGLSRPVGGMPIRWRRQKVEAKKISASPEPEKKPLPSPIAAATREPREPVEIPNLYEIFVKKPIGAVLSVPKTIYKVIDNSLTRSAASKIYLIGRYAAPLLLSTFLVARGRDVLKDTSFVVVREKSPEELAKIQAKKEAKKKADDRAIALKESEQSRLEAEKKAMSEAKAAAAAIAATKTSGGISSDTGCAAAKTWLIANACV